MDQSFTLLHSLTSPEGSHVFTKVSTFQEKASQFFRPCLGDLMSDAFFCCCFYLCMRTRDQRDGVTVICPGGH